MKFIQIMTFVFELFYLKIFEIECQAYKKLQVSHKIGEEHGIKLVFMIVKILLIFIFIHKIVHTLQK